MTPGMQGTFEKFEKLGVITKIKNILTLCEGALDGFARREFQRAKISWHCPFQLTFYGWGKFFQRGSNLTKVKFLEIDFVPEVDPTGVGPRVWLLDISEYELSRVNAGSEDGPGPKLVILRPVLVRRSSGMSAMNIKNYDEI